MVAQPWDAAASPGNVPLILVVEDNEPVLELLKVVLELDYQVISCNNGLQALDLIQRVRPDLALLDVALEGEMTGLELCYRIRAEGKAHFQGSPATKALPILILSDAASRADIRRGMAAGANGYVTKPYSPMYLLDRIATLLGAYDSGETPVNIFTD